MSRHIRFFAIFSLFLMFPFIGISQAPQPVSYDVVYDSPETINKLFVGFQPIYGELWSLNPNVGFGIQANYYHNDKIDFQANIRRTYAGRFDFYRHAAKVNSSVDNEPTFLNHYEFGATFHFKDEITESETSLVLYNKDMRGNKWTAQLPMVAKIPSKLRTITGARLGGIIFDTTVDVDRLIDRQDISYSDITDNGGNPIPTEYLNDLGNTESLNIFTNVNMGGFYVGGSMSWVRNVAVDLEGFEPNIDDKILTAYFDFLITPVVNVHNVFYNGTEYNLGPLKESKIGARLGIEGKHNRELGWGYGAELGIKPGMRKGGFFALVKITVPIYSTNLDENEVDPRPSGN